ncbi:3-hydroxybutyryl-CoA dehydrogenase [Streptomyces sp. 840.1]|uniref:3-hydroxyacyl-CoA dehydrogenase family protein n=1 Tax=Streptomyces sp. 840.1 TaxID=2485152 RepID=UPI000F475A8C|nr:3-hydroxyacyl-CoA dehydrogenase family protein [Streptomyces sp. 840.1]ROQ57460.1 3-hydroxybutyryl-CoA dehydrogenase [Streptomyces sp. 840.1]
MTAQQTTTPVTGIVGLGSTGEALLRLLHRAGHTVVAVDTDLDVLARTAGRLKAALAAEDGPERPGVTFTADHGALRAAGLVIEAVPDDPAVKHDVLGRIVAACPPGTPVVTTTASLSVARLAVATGRPDDIAGLRLFTPPVAGSPVEPVRTALTSPDTAAAVDALVASAGLSPVAVGARPAADATALILGFLNRAVILFDEGYATQYDIDTAMRLGCGLPAGPLETLDHIGLKTAHTALTELWRRTGDCAFEPAPLLSRMVAAGRLGRTSGDGFYTYDETGTATGCTADGPGDPGAAAVRRVGVLGSGAMARGIAEVTAAAGYPTVLVARTAEKADQALRAVEESLTRGIRRGRVTVQTRDSARELLTGAHDMTALAGCDLVIEAVAEDIDVKRAMFAALAEVCAPGTVLATTTSSLSVATCADAAGRPADVVGIHFFNPAPVMRLVELAHTETVDQQILATARAFCRTLGKTTVACPDRTGFIVNSLLFPYLGAALALLERPDVDIEETDHAIRSGFGYPMGPFALLDTIGLDVSLAIQNRLYESFKTPEHEPAAVLEELVAAGLLGRKNGRGLRTSVPRR